MNGKIEIAKFKAKMSTFSKQQHEGLGVDCTSQDHSNIYTGKGEANVPSSTNYGDVGVSGGSINHDDQEQNKQHGVVCSERHG